MAPALPNLSYSHRAKPYSSELELELTESTLVAERGRSRQVFPLAGIEQIRLEFSPRNTARLVFRCHLRARDGKSVTFDSLSWKSLIQTERQDGDYRRFVLELIRRAAAARPDTGLLAGIGALRYRVMQVAGVALVVAMLGVGVMAMMRASTISGLAALALAVYLGFWLREFLTRNHPRRFTPDTIPSGVLPPVR